MIPRTHRCSPCCSVAIKRPPKAIEVDGSPVSKRHGFLKRPLRGRLLLDWDAHLGFASVGDEQSGEATKTQGLLQRLVCFDWYGENVDALQRDMSTPKLGSSGKQMVACTTTWLMKISGQPAESASGYGPKTSTQWGAGNPPQYLA